MRFGNARCWQLSSFALFFAIDVYFVLHHAHIRPYAPAPPATRTWNFTYGHPSVGAIRGRKGQKTMGNELSYNATHRKLPLTSQFHRHWDVTCSSIFAGNETAIASANEQLRRERQVKSLMPSDSTVATWTLDCDLYKEQGGYPRSVSSDEEARFPLAYIIVTHKGSAQVERLLRAIYQPQNVYCIHPDLKSSKDFHLAIASLAKCFDNVFIASKLEDVQYEGFTFLLSNINCMRDLTGKAASGYPWKYVINLCGQDFPLKTNLQIVRQLKALNGHNDIASYTPNARKRMRTQFKFIVKHRSMVRTASKKGPPPHELKVYTGSGYYAVTREFVRYVLSDPVATDFLDWTKDVLVPEETYWSSLQRAKGVPGGDGTEPSSRPYLARYVNWLHTGRLKGNETRCRGKYVRSVCILTVGDLQYIQRQPNLFANKFYYENDPVTLQCLEEVLNSSRV